MEKLPPINSELLDLLCCPETGESLVDLGEQIATENQARFYPKINGIPWLFKNPLHSMVDWSVKLNHFNQVIAEEIRILKNDLKRAPKFTKLRIERLLEGKEDFLAQVSALVSPIVQAKVTGKPIYDALSDRAPHTQNLLSYEANLYRDWVWGEEENELTSQIVCELLKKLKGCEDPVSSHFDSDKFLVLGAGSCRLAFDIHQALKPHLTLANDINPLLLFAAQKVLFGEGLSIREFPAQPRGIDSIGLNHLISPVKAPLDNFHLLFSDAASPSIKPESIDVVITPWLIDIQPFELGKFLSSVNHYLPVGGQWINFGSLVFNQNRDVLCYTIDEIKTVASEAGFELENISEHEIPYLKSPYNAGYRMEKVWCWSARKIKSVAQHNNLQNLPDWLLNPTKSIPKTREIQSFAFSHGLYAELANRIDGKSSITQISKRIAKEKSMDEKEAFNIVKSFYQKIVQQTI